MKMRKMIDISHHNTVDDWKELSKAAHMLCIRCAFGISGSDNKFYTHINGALERNIPFGIYIYSYAKTASEAEKEIDRLVEYSQQFDDCKFIVWDREEKRGDKNLNSLLVTAACNHIIEKENTLPFFVYGDQNYYQTNYDSDAIEKIDMVGGRWIARYNKTEDPDIPCDIWQFTNSYKVNGNLDNFDCSYVTDSCYKWLMNRCENELRTDLVNVEGKLAIMPKESCNICITQKQGGDKILFNIDIKYMEE